MRRLRVLYAGPVLAGRRTSLGSLSGVLGCEGELFNPPCRLDGQEITLPSGETILLDAMVPHTGSFAFDSIEQASRSRVDWIRELAIAVMAFLPTIDGVVFVADSTPFGQGRNLSSLREILGELRAAGLDVDRLPFVFQCNKRDALDALPIAEVTAPLATARCAYVESVTNIGHGVTRALESLIGLLDGGAPGNRPSPPVLVDTSAATAATDLAPPSVVLRLFADATTDLTSDGDVRVTHHVSTCALELELTDAAIAGQYASALTRVRGLAPGRYAVDLAERAIELREPGGWRVVRGRVMAARIRLRDATASRHELMPPLKLKGAKFVTIGLPLAVGAAKPASIAEEIFAQARAHGVAMVARQGSRFELASRAEMAIVSIASASHIWLGRDRAGRVVEVSIHGIEGALVLEKMARDRR